MTEAPNKARPWWRQRRTWLIASALGFGLLLWFVPPVWQLNSGPVEVTRWRLDRGEVQEQIGPKQAGWINVETISRHVLHAMTVSEDDRFYEHSGLDFREIHKSFEQNIKAGRYVRGASTITQQVIKVSFLSRQKSLVRKAREAAGALLVEQVLSKDEILEWYINLVEFGDGVYGIREGAWHYFETKPEMLTIDQAIHLALVLPSPNRWSKGLRRRDLTDFGRQRFSAIANRMRQRGYITATQWDTLIATGNFGRPVDRRATVDPVASEAEAVPDSEASPTEVVQPLESETNSTEAVDAALEAAKNQSTDPTTTQGEPQEATVAPPAAEAEAEPNQDQEQSEPVPSNTGGQPEREISP